MMQTSGYALKDLVLLGGGHSHVAVLRSLGMRPMQGLRITLVTREVHTPYSGMLPGYIAGHYDYDQVHIDLRPLAHFAHAQLVQAEAVGLDLAENRVLLRDRPPLRFDVLSINTGARPNSLGVPGVAEHAIPVKPIDQFLPHWQQIIERVRTHRGRFRLAIVGGGAGGVELAFSAHRRLHHEAELAGNTSIQLEFGLLTDSDALLPTHNARARATLTRLLQERGVHICTGCKVIAVEPGRVVLHDRAEPADAVLWVTHASPLPWIAQSGLSIDERGFIRITDTLRSVSHAQVFAAGDTASMDGHPRPKSGVYAVRQGPPLTENLRRSLTGQPLKRYRPQHSALSLISTGSKNAVASRGFWYLRGDWVWTLKDHIDRQFVDRYNVLPDMPKPDVRVAEGGLADREALTELSELAMRCGGCGAKVGATVLARVMNRLTPHTRPDVLIGLDAPDDAAVVQVPPGKLLVETVDYFRAFIDDPYTFGRIAANHALGDIYAMGAEPYTALAIATVPYAREAVLEEQLFQLMNGALEELNRAGAALIGGHSSEGVELAFGLSLTGLADPGKLMRKGGMRPGDALILTKAIGTGTLFAADMRRKAKGRWVSAALESMLRSNGPGAACALKYGATACTDVTGFGLLGHLVEMLRASGVDAELDLDALPLLEGALETMRLGIFSSLQPQNIRLRRALQQTEHMQEHPHFPLLFDPQTAGGLLTTIPEAQAEACLNELHRLGYTEAVCIGRVHQRCDGSAMVRLTASRTRNGHG